MKRINLFGLVTLLVGMMSLSFNLPKAYASVDCTARGIGVDLSACDLSGANLSSANLSGIVWNNTTCPDGTVSNVQCAVLYVDLY